MLFLQLIDERLGLRAGFPGSSRLAPSKATLSFFLYHHASIRLGKFLDPIALGLWELLGNLEYSLLGFRSLFRLST